jgi:immune inhibitor A
MRGRRPSLLVAGASALVALIAPAMPGLAQEQAQPQQPSEAAEQAPGLRATASPSKADVAAGEAIAVTGVVRDGGQVVGQGRVRAVLVDPQGQDLAETEAVVNPNGTYEVAFPASATRDLELDDTYQQVLATRVTVIEADGSDGATTSTAVAVSTAPATLLLENNFTSSVGWVQPGQRYPFRLVVRNLRSSAGEDARVRVPAVDGMRFVSATPVGGGAGSATIQPDGTLVWDLGTVPAGSVADPTMRTLVVTARADTLAQDERIVWKNLSTTATLTSDTGQVTAESHGPKVIPPNGTYETARYGDRPFPVVPVNYVDLMYLDEDAGDVKTNSGGDLDEVINDPSFTGSTFNLFQEMSYGQLYPQAAIPSANIATADWTGFDLGSFHEREVPKDPDHCFGDYYEGGDIPTTVPERIHDGVYQLPGDVEFYGSDAGETGDATVDSPRSIDDACGDIGKAVYDAAAVADPEIDYNEYDTDKDGVVDFFMMVFAGCGGNGPSQRDCEEHGPYDGTDETDYTTGDGPYDNIWPHSSTLEGGFIDADTGLPGYVSDDRLTDLQGNLLFYTDATRTTTTTTETDYPAYVRVGPYNVNPEDSLDAASVISHEYGHSLGLPDYYSLSPYGTDYYGTWNLMAADYSQHMDINGRQELGWVVPKEIPAGADGEEVSLVDSTIDINEIQWQTPDGEAYTLSGPSVHNGDAWTAPLPRRLLLDPDLVDNGASPTHVWWSQSGNDFGCVPAPSAHSIDIPLSALEDVAPGTDVELRFNTYFDIEWDYDYGFVLATTDDGASYDSIPNEEGWTLPASDNPNGVGCQEKFGNGLTGNSHAWEDGDGAPERASLDETPGTQFLPSTWDLSDYAGEDTTIRFAYNTDVGYARPGWFIDDVEVVAGGDVIYSNDFEDGDATGVLNGGCDGDIEAGPCTAGWQYVQGGEQSTADHAYYIEARDRAGFDADAHGQADRGPILWDPGVSLVYTDEARGYGNTQAQDRPNTSVLDAEPVPFDITAYDPGDPTTFEPSWDPDLSDAAWKPGSDPYSDFGDGHEDNYLDFESPDYVWRLAFDCLGMDVTSMTGDDVGPAIPPGNLRADVAFTRGDGCGSRDYGFGGAANARPTAVAQVKETTVRQGVPVKFDASGSADDVTPKSELAFAWDFDGDGTTDATGMTVRHTYETLGEYEATLTVTDEDGAEGTDTLAITVTDDKDVAARLAGGDRIATAIELSRKAFADGADTAIIGQSQNYPDALAASTLAAEVAGPTLLNPTEQLDPRVVAELQRLRVDEVIIVGGSVAISEEVESGLEQLDVTVRRIGGATRIETAAMIGEEVVARGGAVSEVVVARARDFADALAAGNLGTAMRAPILLTGQEALDPATLAALRALDPDRVTVAGGTVAIPTSVEKAIEAVGFTVRRIGGATRVDTALMLAREAQAHGAGVQPVILANAYNYPDALAAGPAAHAMGGVLVTVEPSDADAALNDAVFRFLAERADALDTVYIAGGSAAIDTSFDAAALDAITTDEEAASTGKLPSGMLLDAR